MVWQVKLNPSLADAWLSLGNCIWKKGDLSSAKNCFSLALSKVFIYNSVIIRFPSMTLANFIANFTFWFQKLMLQSPNKKILCQLSMLERRMAQRKETWALGFYTQLFCTYLSLFFRSIIWFSKYKWFQLLLVVCCLYQLADMPNVILCAFQCATYGSCATSALTLYCLLNRIGLITIFSIAYQLFKISLCVIILSFQVL